MKTVTISILESGITTKIHEGPFDPDYGTIHECTANIPNDAWDYTQRELAGGEKDGAYQSEVDGKLYAFKVNNDLSTAAAVMGRKGGSVKSARKTAAVRENAKKGGRPRRRDT